MKDGRRLVASAALTSGFLIAGLVFAGSASAHVKVSGVDTVQGGSGVITFRVPSESDTASTTGLLITFPAATPFTSVAVQPKAGWTVAAGGVAVARCRGQRAAPVRHPPRRGHPGE